MPPKQLPYNQVERKYREGLDMELERLRMAVPTLSQGDCGAAVRAAKPSKAMVLAAAINYIKKIERERKPVSSEELALTAVYAIVRKGARLTTISRKPL